MNELLSKEVGKRIFTLGNEAMVRGALEAGLSVAAAYPGTPSSEIGNTLAKISRDAGVYFEFSPNEKVAMEVAGAAAVSGVRSMAFMKHVGLNVASDAFMTLAYTGVRGGMVIICADDPGCHSSQNEQDNRYYAKLANMPMLEPSDPQEAKEMVRQGFDLSESLELPFLVRTTTRVNHVRGPITLGEMKEVKRKTEFVKDPMRFVVIPAVARSRRLVLLSQMEKASEMSETTHFNFECHTGNKDAAKVGVITSGVSYTYVMDVAKEHGFDLKVLKLGMTHPLPEKKIAGFLESVDKVVIVEELEDILESAAKKLANEKGIKTPILGKNDGLFDIFGEFNPDIVLKGLSKAMGANYSEPDAKGGKITLPSRPPSLCPGCPHRATYYAAKKASKKDTVYSMDIGCYTLGLQPPMKMADILLCMGSSTGAAGGLCAATDHPVISFIGDSTFFHSGLPGIINGIHNGHKFVVCILDNSTTAMTGHQPHPGLPVDGCGGTAPALSIENIVRGAGVEFVKVTDPNDLSATRQVFKDALAHDGVAVIISKKPCILLELRAKRKAGEKIEMYTIDQDKCTQCKACINTFACTAFYLDGETVKINDSVCNGCGVCVQVCPVDAIGVVQ